MLARSVGRIIGRGFCAGALVVSLTPVVSAAAVSCPDYAAKRIETFRKTAAAGAARCSKRSARTGVACPDTKLSDQLAKKQARLTAAVAKRCPGSPIDQALAATQTAVYCQVLAICEPITVGEVTQRLVALSGLGEPPAVRDLTVDIGWTGIMHDLRLLEGAQFTAALSNCDGDTDTLCNMNAATTGLSFGPPSPLAGGGISVCVMLDFASDLTGTLDVATGAMTEQASLHGSYYVGIDHDHPCPMCVPTEGDPEVGASGACWQGPNHGQPCTIQGLTGPVLGGVSHDCSPNPQALIGEFTTSLAPTTGSLSWATTNDSPKCTHPEDFGEKCLCDTCNDAAGTVCATNADCPESGGTPGICGGRRCLGGTNVGMPCAVNSDCPGSPNAPCGRNGEPTRTDSCYEDSCTPDGNGKGHCAEGPEDEVCEIESWRYCLSDDHCPHPGDHCRSRLRTCFLDPIEASGTPDVPANDTSNPTLVGGFCMGPSFSAAINNVTGLPGPVRFVWPAQLTFGE